MLKWPRYASKNTHNDRHLCLISSTTGTPTRNSRDPAKHSSREDSFQVDRIKPSRRHKMLCGVSSHTQKTWPAWLSGCLSRIIRGSRLRKIERKCEQIGKRVPFLMGDTFEWKPLLIASSGCAPSPPKLTDVFLVFYDSFFFSAHSDDGCTNLGFEGIKWHKSVR